jgi:hypothetical protein
MVGGGVSSRYGVDGGGTGEGVSERERVFEREKAGLMIMTDPSSGSPAKIAGVCAAISSQSVSDSLIFCIILTLVVDILSLRERSKNEQVG